MSIVVCDGLSTNNPHRSSRGVAVVLLEEGVGVVVRLLDLQRYGGDRPDGNDVGIIDVGQRHVALHSRPGRSPKPM